jgi:hypothetical protein
MTHGTPLYPPAALSRYYDCRKCHGGVAILAQCFRCREGNGPEHEVMWAGGVCAQCGHRTQFGHGGTPSDYRHARFWVWGKEAESLPGRVRVASPAFWEFVTDERNSRLHEVMAFGSSHAQH